MKLFNLFKKKELLVTPDGCFWRADKWPRNKTKDDEKIFVKIIKEIENGDASITSELNKIPNSPYRNKTIRVNSETLGEVSICCDVTTMFPMIISYSGADFSNKYVANDAFDILNNHPALTTL